MSVGLRYIPVHSGAFRLKMHKPTEIFFPVPIRWTPVVWPFFRFFSEAPVASGSSGNFRKLRNFSERSGLFRKLRTSSESSGPFRKPADHFGTRRYIYERIGTFR